MISDSVNNTSLVDESVESASTSEVLYSSSRGTPIMEIGRVTRRSNGRSVLLDVTYNLYRDGKYGRMRCRRIERRSVDVFGHS